MASPRPQYSSQGYLPNGTSSGPAPGAQALLPNNGRIIQNGATRVLCVADVRGNLRSLNDLAKTAKADYILHTGDFGFYDESSLERIAEKTLKHVAQYSPLIPEHVKRQIAQTPAQRSIKGMFPPEQLPLSELPQLLNKQIILDVPVYTVWGACEDVRVLERFRSGEYKVDKLHIIDEVNSRLLDIGGVKLRLLGLGGAVVIHKLFDNGEGKTYIAGGQGTMWTTLLQIGSLIDTANRVYDPSETRIFLTHASPARDGILNQLSVTLKADFSISAGLHFRYGSSYNEFSVNPSLDHYRGKLAASRASFNDVWETVKVDVEQAISSNDSHKTLLQSALEIVEKMPTGATGGNPFGGPTNGIASAGQVDESAFKNMWNFNLADAAFGYLVLEVDGGRIGTEMRAQGFNFAHRGGKPNLPLPSPQGAAPAPIAASTVPQAPPTGPGQSRQPMFPPNQSPFPSQQQPSQPPSQPAQAPPRPQHQTPSAPKTQSPAPAPPTTQAKPTTPQPVTTNVNMPPTAPAEKAPAPITNGASGAAKASDSESTKAKPATPPAERKPSSALFVQNVDSEQEARNLIPSEDQDKIKQLIKVGKFNSFAIYFETHDIAKSAMSKARVEADKKKSSGRGPKVSWFEERTPRPAFHQRENQSQGGAGQWQGSARGGANAAVAPAATTTTTTRGGYQSGGTASDSDGARGRGAFGGRGRGGRGDRGARGGQRGGGRGSFANKTTDGTADVKAEKPATPATEAKAESA